MDYDCYDNITTSDHSPVFAAFKLSILLPTRGFLVQARASTPKKKYKLVIEDLRATNLLAVDGKSGTEFDTHLEISGFAITDVPIRTPTLSKVVNPAWSEAVVILPLVQSIYYLRSEHVFIDIHTDEALIGRCIIPLLNVFVEEAVSFLSNATKGGHITGIVSGKIRGFEDTEEKIA